MPRADKRRRKIKGTQSDYSLVSTFYDCPLSHCTWANSLDGEIIFDQEHTTVDMDGRESKGVQTVLTAVNSDWE